MRIQKNFIIWKRLIANKNVIIHYPCGVTKSFFWCGGTALLWGMVPPQYWSALGLGPYVSLKSVDLAFVVKIAEIKPLQLFMCARGINVCVHVWTHTRTFSLCVCAYVHRLVHYSVMSLSFKYHKDLIFRCGDICKIAMLFFGRYCISSYLGLAIPCKKIVIFRSS